MSRNGNQPHSNPFAPIVDYFQSILVDLSEGNILNLSPKRQINLNLAGQLTVSLGFAISTYFVASFANVGFNVVATALANAVFASGALYVINQHQDPGSIGFVIGSGSVMSFLSLLTAVYWGQLSQCQGKLIIVLPHFIPMFNGEVVTA